MRGKAESGGWRAGKSLSAGMEGLTWLPYARLIWIIARDYERTRPEFTYLAEGAVSTGLALPQNVNMPLAKHAPWAMRSITDCEVETITLADYKKSLTAKAPDLVIVCEPGLIEDLPNVMELLWGRVSEKRGGIVLAGTSDEASEEWWELFESWAHSNLEGGESFSVPTWENVHRYPLGRGEREFKVYEEKYGVEALMAHYGGVPSSPTNLVLRGYWNRRVNIDPDIEFDPSKPVEIAIDPNYSMGHRYAVQAIQWDPISPRLRMVDEVAEEGMTHDEVRAICERKPWWPYLVGGTIDPYAGESHIFGAPAPVSYWDPPLSLRLDHRPQVNTTVQALKEALADGVDGPRLLVASRCERFIYEADRWRNNKMRKPALSPCDSLKASGYWLVDRFAQERTGRDEDNVVRVTDYEFDA